MSLDVRVFEYKEARSLLMMLVVNQRALVDILKDYIDRDDRLSPDDPLHKKIDTIERRYARFMAELDELTRMLQDED